MSVIDTTRSVPLGAVSAFRFVSFVERAIQSVAAWRDARSTASALGALSDRQLDDIGLNRGDIADVATSLAAR